MITRQAFIYLGIGTYKPYAFQLAKKLRINPNDFLNEPEELDKIKNPAKSLLYTN